jgi:hypothetical protein
MTFVDTEAHAGAAMAAPIALGPGANGALATPAPPFVAARPRRPRVARHSDEVLEEARSLVEGTTLTLRAIAAQLGVSNTTLSVWARKGGWIRPAGAPPLRTAGGGRDAAGQRARLVARLYRTYGRQLGALEKRAQEAAGETVEKDARTLGVLAKTLETLIAFDRDDGARVKEPEPVDRDELDADLARRIARWAEGGGTT